MQASTGNRSAWRFVLALVASVVFLAGSPVVAASSANGGGLNRTVSAKFGDCKNQNTGEHLGYQCPSAPGGILF